MSETNFDWDDLRLFLAVAKSGGLAGAVESTGKSAPTLGRRMLSLEKRLGQELFERQARGYILTQSGQDLLDTALNLEQGISPILSSVKEPSPQRVKISAGTWVTHLLSQHISALLADDAVVLQFISADHALDFSHREAVIGVRNQRPREIALAGRQVGEVAFAVYATSPEIDTWVSVVGTTPSANWVREQLSHAQTNHKRIDQDCSTHDSVLSKLKRDHPYIEVTDPRNAMDMAISGAAKVVLPTFIGDATTGLVRVTGTIDVLSHTQWLVTHHEERHVPEVRRVIERIQTVLSATNSLAATKAPSVINAHAKPTAQVKSA